MGTEAILLCGCVLGLIRTDTTLDLSQKAEKRYHKLSEVALEGWVRLWENPHGIPSADIPWLKEDAERGLFTPVQSYRDKTGLLKRRLVMKPDRMWFYPPEPPGYVRGAPPAPQLFYRSRVFVWHPVGVWRCSLKCPRGEECVGGGRNVHLYKSGYHQQVCHICDVSSWYTMLTEVLCCGPFTKAARSGECGTVGRWLVWDPAILSQLSDTHRTEFPAVLTGKCGVDRNVVCLLRDRTRRSAVVKAWQQIEENHAEGYLHRTDLYTTLLMTVAERGGHTFQAPPPPREPPSVPRLPAARGQQSARLPEPDHATCSTTPASGPASTRPCRAVTQHTRDKGVTGRDRCNDAALLASTTTATCAAATAREKSPCHLYHHQACAFPLHSNSWARRPLLTAHNARCSEVWTTECTAATNTSPL